MSLADEIRAARARVAELAARVPYGAPVDDAAGGGGGDSFSPDFGQVIAADGSVTYDLQAHLKALGLDLDAGAAASPPDDRKIRWLSQPDGAVVAELAAYSIVPPNTQGGYWRVTRPGSPDVAQLGLGINLANSKVDATAANGGNAATATIIDSNGASGFAQLSGGTHRALFSWALVAADGTLTAGSPDVGAQRTGVGSYVVTYATRSAGAAVLAQLRDPANSAEQAIVTFSSATTSVVNTLNPGVAFVDRPFSILVIG